LFTNANLPIIFALQTQAIYFHAQLNIKYFFFRFIISSAATICQANFLRSDSGKTIVYLDPSEPTTTTSKANYRF